MRHVRSGHANILNVHWRGETGATYCMDNVKTGLRSAFHCCRQAIRPLDAALRESRPDPLQALRTVAWTVFFVFPIVSTSHSDRLPGSLLSFLVRTKDDWKTVQPPNGGPAAPTLPRLHTHNSPPFGAVGTSGATTFSAGWS